MDRIHFNSTGASILDPGDSRALDITIEANLDNFAITDNKLGRVVKKCRLVEVSKVSLKSHNSSNWIEFYFEDGDFLTFAAPFSRSDNYKTLQHQLRLLNKAAKAKAKNTSSPGSLQRLVNSVELLEGAGIVSTGEAQKFMEKIKQIHK